MWKKYFYRPGEASLKNKTILLLVLNEKLFTLFAGYSEPSSAGGKQYTVGFTAPDDSSSTATAEIAVNGMDPPELGFSPAESTTGTSGQSRRITCSSRLHTPTVTATKDRFFFHYIYPFLVLMGYKTVWSNINSLHSLNTVLFWDYCFPLQHIDLNQSEGFHTN